MTLLNPSAVKKYNTKSGGQSVSSSSDQNGGSGAVGVVIITEYF